MTHEPGVKISFLKQEWLLGGITASCCSLGPSTGFTHAGGSALASLGIADHSVCVPANFCSSPQASQISWMCNKWNGGTNHAWMGQALCFGNHPAFLMLIAILSTLSESCFALPSLPATMPGSLCCSSQCPLAPTHYLAPRGRPIHWTSREMGYPKCSS